MELDTVGALVTALVSTYDDGLECYTRWQRKRWQANHYQGHERGREAGSGSCGLSTSLMVSKSQVRQVYDSGADVLGDAFSTGDKQCRSTLQSSLLSLQTHVEALRSAARRDNGSLELWELIRASEAARASSLRALAEQYQRVAVGRLVPRELLPVRPSPPRRLSAVSSSSSVELNAAAVQLTPEVTGDDDDGAEGKVGVSGVGDGHADGHSEDPGEKEAGSEQGDGDDDAGVEKTASQSHGTTRPDKSPFQPQPPSPPPTPKMIPDDLQSTCTSESGPRPRASVFSVFCPEAMKYQVDLKKPMPSSSALSPLTSQRRKKNKDCCGRCGYRWSDAGDGDGNSRDSASRLDHNNVAANATTRTMVKDGFRLTPRFLGKSHCSGGGFGCVLCTSSGRTDVYDSVEGLRDHINASHDKWQMLHERDMANR